MKTIFATEKSEYSYCLIKSIDNKTPPTVRLDCFSRMREIERYIKSQGDEIQIVVTTKNTSNQYVAPAMTEADIKKNKDL